MSADFASFSCAIFADYEGLGVAIAQGLWLLVTIPALLLAVGGIVAGAWKKPNRKLAGWLGATACVVEIGGILMVWLAFADEQARLGEYAERFRPGLFFWFGAVATVAAGLWAVYLGVASPRMCEE
jgi:hypothetical protein